MAIEYEKLNTLRYGIYCRKSSDSEDKQVQSIDTQRRQLGDFSKRNGLKIVKEYTETKSAFKGGQREIFDEMISDLNKGLTNGLLVIHPSRISRNMTDGAKIIELLDREKLLCIRSEYQVYRNISSDKFMLTLDLATSKKESDDKSVSVKQGQKTKALKGVPHGVASLGFLNDKTEEKGNRKWLVDELRLKAIKTLFEMFLTGTYSAGKLHRYAIKELKLTTVKRKRIGGGLITLSRIYEILKDPIYAGFFLYGGERYELDANLPRLITEDDRNKVLNILSKRHIPKVQHHETTFSGFLQSEEGDFIGQDVKYQLICDCKEKFAYRSKTHCPKCGKKIAELENPKYLSFIYYYNVRKKKAGQEYKSIADEKITEEILTFIDENLTFSQEFAEWSKKYITELKDKEINESIFRKQKNQADRVEYETKKSRLREMLRDQQITDDEYKVDLETLSGRYAITGTKKNDIDWYSKMNEIADLTLCMKEILEKGSMQAKRNILSKLGSNLIWNDEKLSISNSNAINKLVEGIKRAKAINSKFEPKNYRINKGLKEKTSSFQPVFSTLLRGEDSNLRPIGYT